jgi:hypothetical protein
VQYPQLSAPDNIESSDVLADAYTEKMRKCADGSADGDKKAQFHRGFNAGKETVRE